MLRQLNISNWTGGLRAVNAPPGELAGLLRPDRAGGRHPGAFLSYDVANAEAQADEADRLLAAGVTHQEKPLLGCRLR